MTSQSTASVLLPALFLLLPWHLAQSRERVELVSGDVMLSAMFGVNSLDGDGCGLYDVNVLKRLTAVTWFLDALNGADYFGGGVRLGLTAYRTCQNKGRAMTHAVEILNEFDVLTPQSVQSANSTIPLLGLLGPDRTEEAKAVSRFFSSLPPAWRPLQISASATGEVLSDKTLYSNLFRVIPPDSVQVDVLVKLLKALHWNYIAVVYNEDDYGRVASERLRSLAAANDICVPYHAEIPLDTRTLDFSQAVGNIADVVRDKLIKGLVFIGNRATAKEFLTIIEQRVLFLRFIFSEAMGLQDSVFKHLGDTLALSKGAFVVTPPSRPLPEFKQHWNAVWTNRTLFLRAAEANPWLAEYLSELSTDCTVTEDDVDDGDSCWSVTQDKRPLLGPNTRWLFEFYNVKAVAIFAAALKNLIITHCHGWSQPAAERALCPAVRDILMRDRQTVRRLLQNSSFDLEREFANVTSAFQTLPPVRFDAAGEMAEQGGSAESVYDVFNFQQCQEELFCFMKVGSLSRDRVLTLNMSAVRGYGEDGQEMTAPDLPKAQCSDNAICAECLPSNLADEIIMVPGDFYFVAVAPANDRDRKNAQGCGPIMTSSGVDMVQGALYSLEKVNSEGIFSGDKKLGVIFLNSCYRELVIKRKLMDLYGGRLQLPDGRNSSAILPYIAGYVGGYYSTISVAVYEVLSKITDQFVVLSPTNTSPNLSDRQKYPNFLRLMTKSNDQVKVMLDIVRRLNSSYVQVVYDPKDVYSSSLMASINQLSQAPPFNICVIHNVNTSYDDDSLGRVRDQLLQYSWASVVIVVLQYEHVRNFTNVVTTAIKPNQFVFIGSETWERQPELIDPVNGLEKRLDGSFVLYQGLPVDRQFDAYFRKLDPFSSINPWLRYFWESAENCYFEDSFQKMGKKPCPVGASWDDSKALTDKYVQGAWVPFYISAVKVFAQGLHAAMEEICQTLTLCEALKAEDLIRKLKDVRMDMTGNGLEERVFDANGDGGLGFDVYQVQRQHGKLVYVKVGSYLNGHGSLTTSTPLPRPGHCLTQEQCQRCFPPSPSLNSCHTDNIATKEALQSADEPYRTAFIAVLSLLIVLVIICVIIIVVVFLTRRRIKAQASKSQRHTSTSSLHGLQNTDLSEMKPVPESGNPGFRRLHSSPLPSVASSGCAACGGGGDKASSYKREDPTYLEINVDHGDVPDVVFRGGEEEKEDAAFAGARAASPLPPPPAPAQIPAPPPPVCRPSKDPTYLRPCLNDDAGGNGAATLNRDYVPRYGGNAETPAMATVAPAST